MPSSIDNHEVKLKQLELEVSSLRDRIDRISIILLKHGITSGVDQENEDTPDDPRVIEKDGIHYQVYTDSQGKLQTYQVPR